METFKFISFFLVLALTSFLSSSDGFKFYVGGRDGWVLNPSENYNNWAGRNRFQVNDTLYFKYKEGTDSVLVVNKNDYYNCNIDKPILKLENGDATFMFDRSGPFFFISGNKTNCEKGQKLIIIVLAVRHSIHAPPAPVSQVPAAAPTSPPTGIIPAPSTLPISPAPAILTPVSSPSPLAETPVPSPAPVAASPSQVILAPTASSISPSEAVPATETPSSGPSASENTPGGSSSARSSAPPVVVTPSIVILSLITLWLSVYFASV